MTVIKTKSVRNSKPKPKRPKRPTRPSCRLLDAEWSKLVRTRDKECVLCGATEHLDAHHLITRRIRLYRHDIDNGVTLCKKHHKFDVHRSAHTAPWFFEMVLKDIRPEQYLLWVERRERLALQNVALKIISPE